MQHKPNSIFEAAAMVLRKVNESAPDDDTVLNDIKKLFPSGSKIDKLDNSLRWEKTGGFAGEKTISTAEEKLKKAGFKNSDLKTIGLPDGSTSGFRTYLLNKKLGWYVELIQFYGATSSSNKYVITLKKV